MLARGDKDSPPPDAGHALDNPLPVRFMESFQNRVAHKLAELQSFLDDEFQYATARSCKSIESSKMCNLDELSDLPLNPPEESTGTPEENGHQISVGTYTSGASQDNEAFAKSDDGFAQPPVDVQEKQPAEPRSSSTELAAHSNRSSDYSGRSRKSVMPRVSIHDFMSNAATSSFRSMLTSQKLRTSKEYLGEVQQNPLKKFVTSMRFDYISALLVISNSAFIGVQVEFMYAKEAPLSLTVIDMVFCMCFLSELALRLYARGFHGFFVTHDPGWNRFDFFIVTTSTFDTLLSLVSGGQNTPLGSLSLLRIARIIRITRVLRIIRVMKFFKDMRILIAAIASTLNTACWALLLLLMSMYMFSIAIGQMVAEHMHTMSAAGTPLHNDDTLRVFFGSIGANMYTLFMTVSGGINWRDASETLSINVSALIVYIFFITFSSFCMLNVITGIFCQCAIETFENDKDILIECQLAEKERFVRTLTEMFQEWDSSGDGTCSKREFELHINDQKMQTLLSTLDIETRDAMALYTMMDRDGTGRLNLDDFINGCITLRGGAKAIHMERALVDGKQTIYKLDRIIRRIEELGDDLRANFTKGDPFMPPVQSSQSS